jgi:methionine-rich copper-binding protein CopC
VLAVILTAVPEVQAHAKLVRSSPPKDGMVASSPSEIRLKFNEAVAAKLSRVDITDAAANKVAVGPAAADGQDKTELIVPVSDVLPAGKYRVRWHVVSADMHKIEGEFSFEIRP